MLTTRSPVFCAMFTGPAKDENSEIKIEDVDKDAFKEMLRYHSLFISRNVYNTYSCLTKEPKVYSVIYC